MADVSETPRRDPSEEIASLGPEGRLRSFEDRTMSAEAMWLWAAHHPEEVPLVNGELPWIALTLE